MALFRVFLPLMLLMAGAPAWAGDQRPPADPTRVRGEERPPAVHDARVASARALPTVLVDMEIQRLEWRQGSDALEAARTKRVLQW